MNPAETVAAQLARFLDEHAVSLIQQYRSGGYSGHWFDVLEPRGDDPEVAGRFTGVDIAALTTLEVRAPAWLTIDLLDLTCSGRMLPYEHCLAAIPTDVALHEAPQDLLGKHSPWEALWRALRSYKGIGPVTASKLLARKRPHLVPIRDRHVVAALVGDPHGEQIAPLRWALRACPELVDRLQAIRREAGAGDLSLLRVCDIVVWMRQHGLDDPNPRGSQDPPRIEPPRLSALASPQPPHG